MGVLGDALGLQIEARLKGMLFLGLGQAHAPVGQGPLHRVPQYHSHGHLGRVQHLADFADALGVVHIDGGHVQLDALSRGEEGVVLPLVRLVHLVEIVQFLMLPAQKARMLAQQVVQQGGARLHSAHADEILVQVHTSPTRSLCSIAGPTAFDVKNLMRNWRKNE